MDTAKELQVLREELIREIDEKIGQMLKKLQNENNTNHQKNHVQTRVYESVYPLNVGTGIYKGKRPTAVIFPGEVRKECRKNLERHQMIMDLRGKILGRNRVLLGSETGKMRSPVKIDEALFVETHYDAETLLRILTTRILDEVGYDYSKIQIAVKTE